jgi:hypothetical protein
LHSKEVALRSYTSLNNSSWEKTWEYYISSCLVWLLLVLLPEFRFKVMHKRAAELPLAALALAAAWAAPTKAVLRIKAPVAAVAARAAKAVTVKVGTAVPVVVAPAAVAWVATKVAAEPVDLAAGTAVAAAWAAEKVPKVG